VAGWLEKLNEISGRVYQENLRSAGAGDDLVSKRCSGATQSRDLSRQIAYDKVDAIPPPGSRLLAIGHYAPRRTGRPTQQ
jgi:hypothetical protein